MVSGLAGAGHDTSFCCFKDIVLYYDCLSAGKAAEGVWHPSSSFTKKVPDLPRWIESAVGIPFQFEHVKAHTGHPLNDYVDWAAKQTAAGAGIGGRPPDSTITAFQALDLSWMATACAANASKSLPIQYGSALVSNSTVAFDRPGLQPADLIPGCKTGTVLRLQPPGSHTQRTGAWRQTCPA